MKKYLSLIILAIVIIVAAVWVWNFKFAPSVSPGFPPTNTPDSGSISYKDATYIIEGKEIKLTNGLSEIKEHGDSFSVTTTQYFGNDATGDFNGDGLTDVAFILTQDTGGTGNFYYVVAALKTGSGYQGTNAVFLGDRIAPQTTEFRNGKIIVNYADRKTDESFADIPSVGVSKYLKIENNMIVDVGDSSILPGVSYLCDKGKTIDAVFFKGPIIPVRSGEPPVPTGRVTLAFNDGQSMTLSQTLSADGSRYANSDESFVFWVKGDGALVFQNGIEKDYTNCVVK